MDFINSMWTARAVASVAHLGIADKLLDDQKTIATLAAELNLNPDGLFRLLRVVSGAGVVKFIDANTVALTDLGQSFANSPPNGKPSLRYFFIALSSPGHWLPWGNLEYAIQTGKASATPSLGSDIWSYYNQHVKERDMFAKAMTDFTSSVIPSILANYQFPKDACIVDVGGSHGSFLFPVLEKYPNTTGVLFDLPEIIENVEIPTKLANRATKFAGNFLTGPLPNVDPDIYLLKHILHDWDDEKCVTILSNLRKKMKPNSKIVVAEILIGDKIITGQVDPGALMDLNMLVMCDGKERNIEEFSKLFSRSGFKLGNVVQGFISIIEAIPCNK